MADLQHLPTDELAAFAAAAMPTLAERIPAAPARLLGRLGAPVELDPHGPDARVLDRPGDAEAASLRALRALGPLPVERLLGALELVVAGHDWNGAPALLPGLPAMSDARYAFVATGGHDSEAATAARLVEQLHPGLADRTTALVRAAARHPALTQLLAVPPDVSDEPAIAAAHGAAHLALAVAVAGAVVHQADPSVIVDRPAAAVGLALGATVMLLRNAAMPPAYAAARLAKIRAEYLLPQHMSRSVSVMGHRFGLVEHDLPERVDFGGNGLVAAVDGGVVIRTGVEQGWLRVELVVLAEAPGEMEPGWEEIAEVSWRATEGAAALVAPGGTSDQGRRPGQTPPWPGDYRVRVHARGRDDDDAEFERYKLIVWAAPAAPQSVHQRTDRLGHRLRGEPEPLRAPQPEHAYRWIQRTHLAQAATVTVVTGSTCDQVLRAFGADPSRPEPIDTIVHDLTLRGAINPWITALDTGDAVLVVEDNGFHGTNSEVLTAVSARGRAASMFWNVNAVTRLSFAEQGRLLASFEPFGDEDTRPPVTEALAGLDFAEYGERSHKGLVAVERFTGRGITAADLTQMREAGIGYRVVQ